MFCSERKKSQIEALRTQLEHHLCDEEPISLEEIAAKYRVNARQYYKHFSELANQISHRYLEFRKQVSSQDYLLVKVHKTTRSNIDHTDIQKVLERALTAEIPPSLTQVSKESGYGIDTLRQFPEHCLQIQERYSEYRRALSTHKIEQDCRLIRDVVNQLCKEGIFPSDKRVIERTRPGILGRAECREALLTARSNISSNLHIINV